MSGDIKIKNGAGNVDKKAKAKVMEQNNKCNKGGNIEGDTAVLDDETKKQVIKDLSDKAAGKKDRILTYAEIASRLGDVDLDKDQMDEIYETLIGKGI